MKKSIQTILFLSSCIMAAAQQTHLQGSINSNLLKTISFTKLGMNSYLPKNVYFEMPISKAKTFSGSFTITEKGMYRIGDGWFGHQVFLTPGDSVQLRFDKIEPTKNKDGTTALTPTFHKLRVKTKYPANYTFFDEVTSFFGQTVYPFKEAQFNAEKFKASCDSAYNAAKSRLENYHVKKMASDTFYRYALGELNGRYILWICTPLTYVEKNKMPGDYFDQIKDTLFNDYELLIRTDSYVTAASVYNIYVLNDFNPQRWYSNLDNEFFTAATYFKGILRDRLMGWSITDYKDKNFASFDSLYRFFLAECRNTRIKNEVYNDVKAYRLSETNKPSFDSLLKHTIVTDINGRSLSFNEIKTSKKWVLVDCWASWCIPCKRQLPFLKEFEEKLGDSVEFVYLSFDEKKESWKVEVAKNKHSVKGQFIVKDGFKSSFARYFNLLTIPRYILINRAENSVAAKDLPVPSHQQGFEEAIKDAFAQ
ncbi:MAG: TlpA family protein disulfide reductase [Flavisolibacter sp.]